MLNQVVLVGRITKELDLRYTPAGKAVARFNLAVNRDFKDANGEQQADFPNCQVWGKTAEVMADNLRKGSLISITGRIQTGSYDKDGQRIYTTDVVVEKFHFLESKNDGGNRQTNSNQGGYDQKTEKQNTYNDFNNTPDPFGGHGEPIDISDDDLPF